MTDLGSEPAQSHRSLSNAYIFTADRRAAPGADSHPWVIVLLDLACPRVVLRLKRPDGSPVRVSLDAAVVSKEHADDLRRECSTLKSNTPLTETATPHLHALLHGIRSRFFERGLAVFRGTEEVTGGLEALADAQFDARACAMIAREWEEI